MIGFLRFIFGYVKFKASGGFSERFINLCNLGGITLWDMKSDEKCFEAKTTIAGYRKIKTCAKKSGMSVRICEKKGLPFLYKSLSGRTGLFIGIAVACFCMFFYSRSIWSLEVSGNEKIKSEEVISILAEEGIKPGTFKKDINTDKLKLSVYEKRPDIAWISFNIDGSRLVAELREATKKPALQDSKNICNIVAAKDGVIDKTIVFEGENHTVIGEGVTKGELLVSGVIFHETAKKTTFHRSRAKVYAFTQSENTIRIPKNQEKISYTGAVKHFKELNIFRVSFPLYLFTSVFPSNEVSSITVPCKFGHSELPVSITYYEVRETEKEKYKADKTTAKSLARSKKSEFEKSFSSGCKILSVKEKIKETKTDFYFTYSYKLYENIAKESKIEINEENISDNMEKDEK